MGWRSRCAQREREIVEARRVAEAWLVKLALAASTRAAWMVRLAIPPLSSLVLPIGPGPEPVSRR